MSDSQDPDRARAAEAEAPARFAAALAAAEAAIDWAALGELYCHEGGEHFFPEVQQAALRDAALLFAGDLGTAYAAQGTHGAGRSLYVGAGVAELALLLCEPLVFGREVVAVNLPGPEPEQLDRALAAAEAAVGVPLPRFQTQGIERVEGRFDLLWLASVLNDPVAFPELSAELYGGRTADAARLERDRTRATDLLEACLDRLSCHGANPQTATLATSDEELALVAPACTARGLELVVPDRGRLSGVVGDVIRLCSLRPPRP
jgi:hypothetical protein